MSSYFFPNDLWTTIKMYALEPQQWVNILEDVKDGPYLKAYLDLGPETVLNLRYDTPMKRRCLRLWLRDSPHRECLPDSGMQVLDSFLYNDLAVINWWNVVEEGREWGKPDPATSQLDPRDPLAAPTLESGLTTDKAKAEAWASVATASSRCLMHLYTINDLIHPFRNLLAQTQPGREWEFLVLRRICLGPCPSSFEIYMFEGMMVDILAYFINQAYVETVEVMVSSGVLSDKKVYETMSRLRNRHNGAWIDGIVDGLLRPGVVEDLEVDEDSEAGWQEACLEDVWMQQVIV